MTTDMWVVAACLLTLTGHAALIIAMRWTLGLPHDEPDSSAPTCVTACDYPGCNFYTSPCALSDYACPDK